MGAHIQVLRTVAMTEHINIVHKQWTRVSQDFDCLVLFIAIVVVSLGFIALEVVDETRERQRQLLERDDVEKQTLWKEIEHASAELNYSKGSL
ncbi:uncharacterized protein PG998_007314 [Apiospora kogelbergensis]|uniref:uncharacterized protein n=1 Tax=Apiospora kogelbergensis TaxID=1337665 RepID=UPI003132465B